MMSAAGAAACAGQGERTGRGRGVRYRHVEQVFSAWSAGAFGCVTGGLRRPRLLWGDDEGPAVLGDAVDGVEQLSHGGDEGDLGGLSGGAQAQVEGAQPGVSLDRAQHWHPQGAAQAGVAKRSDAGAGVGSFAGLTQPWDDADVSCEGGGALEVARVAGG